MKILANLILAKKEDNTLRDTLIGTGAALGAHQLSAVPAMPFLNGTHKTVKNGLSKKEVEDLHNYMHFGRTGVKKAKGHPADGFKVGDTSYKPENHPTLGPAYDPHNKTIYSKNFNSHTTPHEIGHAVNHARLGKKYSHGVMPARQLGMMAVLPSAFYSANKASNGEKVSKKQQAAYALSQTPTLVDEFSASHRGYKAMKALHGAKSAKAKAALHGGLLGGATYATMSAMPFISYAVSKRLANKKSGSKGK